VTTVLIDLSVGNLHSAEKAFRRMAAEVGSGPVVVSADPEAILSAERVVLPGDGAFRACREALSAPIEEALREVVERRGRPFLGICVGMQLMAERGLEHGETPGLGWLGGEVAAMEPGAGRKVPHMGWNDLVVERSHPVLDGIATGDHAYFVHGYQLALTDPTTRLAHAEHGGAVTAIAATGTAVGTQFHPEKSQSTGLRLVAAFLRWRP
jgi:glutamine amidotransferase